MRSIFSFAQFAALLPDLHPHEHPVMVVNTIRGSAEELQARVATARGALLDFDGTLHADVQWRLFLRLLSEEARTANAAELARYHARDVHSDQDDVRFGLVEAGRLRGLKRQALFALVREMRPRMGAILLLRSFNYPNVGIVSFGVRDIIREWLRCHLLNACWTQPSVFALDLLWTQETRPDDCVVTGCDPRTIITNGNKGFAGHIFRVQQGLRPGEVLTVVDSPSDLLMMDPDGINILILPKAADVEPGRGQYRLRGLERLWALADAVLVSDTLEPLVAIRKTK